MSEPRTTRRAAGKPCATAQAPGPPLAPAGVRPGGLRPLLASLARPCTADEPRTRSRPDLPPSRRTELYISSIAGEDPGAVECSSPPIAAPAPALWCERPTPRQRAPPRGRGAPAHPSPLRRSQVVRLAAAAATVLGRDRRGARRITGSTHPRSGWPEPGRSPGALGRPPRLAGPSQSRPPMPFCSAPGERWHSSS